MNNMGGLIRCEVVPVTSVDTFIVVNGAVRITLKAGQTWTTLTISTRQTTAGAPPEKSEGTRILGSKEFPLTGTFEEVAGETATDLAGYRLELEATCLHPQLIYKV